MSSKSRRRAERKAERLKQQNRRWSQIPASLYPYEKFEDISGPKSATETQSIIEQQQYLPWSIHKARHPCRPYHPEDLWELGALKKAISNELEGIAETSQTYMNARMHQYQYSQNCLHHILGCWHENIVRHESAGPSFLIHMLRHQYEGELTFDTLRAEDSGVVELVKNAARKSAFHTLVGRLQRSTTMLPSCSKQVADSLSVKHTLHNLVHVAGKVVNTYPRVSEIDFLDEWFFEGMETDSFEAQGDATWHRPILIIIPNNFIDDFVTPIFEQVEDDVDDLEETGFISFDSTIEIASDDEEHSNERDEEIFECVDEETMIEITHKVETSGHELAEVHATYPENDNDVEVQDQAGNKYYMPASFFGG